MPWLETDVLTQRARFVLEHERGVRSFAELCRIFGISRKTGYKIVRRFREEGLGGLNNRSRAPRRQAQRTPADIEAALVQCRKRHPTWGAKKIRDHLLRTDPRRKWPARSTIESILTRNGLIQPRKRRRVASPAVQPLAPVIGPNDRWCSDFKGWFHTGDRTRCDPLTITDSATRYALCCRGLRRTRLDDVQPWFARTFQEYGLPRRMLTDNGPPFASIGLGGLSKLSVWWLRLGIIPERIEPGKPQQNGRHERFHKTLKQDAIAPPKATLSAQQRAFTLYLREYNEQRPHESLEGKAPADLYQASPRGYPREVPEFCYPQCDEVRRVQKNGHFKWRGKLVFLGEAFASEPIGLTAIGDGTWTVQIGPVELAILNEESRSIIPMNMTSLETRQQAEASLSPK